MGTSAFVSVDTQGIAHISRVPEFSGQSNTNNGSLYKGAKV